MHKVLIGCPTCDRYRYCIDEYLEAIKALNYKNYDVLLIDNSKDDSFFKELKNKGVDAEKIEYCEPVRERIVRARNLLLDRAIKGNYDFLFSLEQDIIVKPDVLDKLLSQKKHVVSAYYGKDTVLVLEDKETGEIKKVLIELPLVWLGVGDKIKRANPQEIFNKGLIEIAASGLGCILISREVFTKIRFRYKEDKKAFDDMYFCEDISNLGYKLYLCTETNVKHLYKEWE